MTNPHEAPALISTGVKELVSTARRLGLVWRMRLATVDNVTSADQVLAHFDGDDTSITMVSMINYIPVNTRVYVISVPPAGNFIVGRVANDAQPRFLLGRVDSTSSSAAIGAEAVTLTAPVMSFLNNRAYEVVWRGQYTTSVASTVNLRLRQGTTATDTLLAQGSNIHAAAVTALQFYDSVRIKNSTGATISTALVLCASASAGTVTINAGATNTRYLEIWDIGVATDYANASSMV